MRFLFTIVISALSLNAFSQSDGWEYPFPYNPDGDADGYVTLSDLLDLLPLYGNEYPDSFHNDDSGAILYLGSVAYNECYNQARIAEGNWRLPNTKDILKWGDYLGEEFDQMYNEQWPDGGSNELRYDFHSYDKSGDPSIMTIYYLKVYYPPSQGSQIIKETGRYTNSGNGVYTKVLTDIQSHCFIVTEVRPDIEYHVVLGTVELLKEEVNDSLANGWNLIGGFSRSSSSYCSQAIWRWAE
jgi:hypothetical protein